jgi:glycosyltransferase involved in cell wall biosynthesis
MSDRVCLVTEYFYPEDGGGSPTVLSDLMRRLKDNNRSLTLEVITSHNLYRAHHTRLAPHEDWDGIAIWRLPTPRSNRSPHLMRLAAGALFSAAACLALSQRPRYDAVIVNTNPPTAPGAVWPHCRRTEVPYIYLIHDLYPDLPIAMGLLPAHGMATAIARAAQRRWLHGAQRVVVQGRCARDRLIRRYDLPAERIEVISHWAEPPTSSVTAGAEDFRKRQGWNGFVVLYAGNLGPFQGLDVILDAAAIVASRDPTVRFVLAGSGTRAGELRARLARDRSANVNVMPPVPAAEYPTLLAAADVALVPLARSVEGLGVPSKFYPALGAGRPVLAVMDSGAEIARVVQEADCGLNVNPDDARGLAEAVLRLSREPELCAALGANARATLERHYTLSHIATRYQALLISAIEAGRTARTRASG